MAKVLLSDLPSVTLGELRKLAASRLPDTTPIGLLIVDHRRDADVHAAETSIALVGTHLGRDDVGIILEIQGVDDPPARDLGQMLEDLAE